MSHTISRCFQLHQISYNGFCYGYLTETKPEFSDTLSGLDMLYATAINKHQIQKFISVVTIL
jgi:hypothetical protein